MDLTLFRKLIDSIPGNVHLHLQGWGEPLLNPHILDMIRLSREKGHEVSLTTNGYFLPQKVIDKLVGSLDMLAISYAGVQGVHGSIRSGGDYNTLFENTRRLLISREKYGYETPRVIVAFLMMKNNIQSLPSLVEALAEEGVEEIIANNLDYTPTKPLHSMKIFSFQKVDKEYFHILKRCRKSAKKYGVEFISRPLKCSEQAVCLENPLENLFVSVSGDISPCVYLHLPTKLDYIPRYFEDKYYEVKKVYFGNISKESLVDIWENPEYREFRQIFIDRSTSEALSLFASGLKWYRTEFRYTPNLPKTCATCYKAYGV
jgi:MoaA/NifB/PqqE/SkfB family radical SAM enzyme